MLFWRAKNYLMGAGSPSGSDSDVSPMGIVQGHAYSILDVAPIDGNHLVQLRNPWGEFEWKGDWADDSDDWTEESKKKAGWTDEEDGTFFMCLEDIRKYFSRCQVCRVNDNYKYSYFKARQKHNSYSMIRFTVAEPGGHHYLTISQTDERCFDRKIDYDYSNVRLIVA